MAWEQHTPNTRQVNELRCTIYQNLNGYFNAACDRQYLDGYESCYIHRDAEAGRLAVEPVSEGDYSLSRSDGKAGVDVNFKSALRAIGLEEDALDDSVFVDVDWTDSLGSGAIVIDVSHLIEDETADDNADSDTGAEVTTDTSEPADADASEADVVTNGDDEAAAEFIERTADADREDSVPSYDADSTTENVITWLDRHGSVGFEFTASEIANDTGEHGVGIGKALAHLDAPELGFSVGKADQTANGITTWVCEPYNAPPDGLWCGRCGDGPFDDEHALAGHDSAAGHIGTPIPIKHEPSDDELTPDPSHEIPGSLTEADVVAVARHFDTLEDVAADLEVEPDRAEAILRDLQIFSEVEG